MCYFFSLNSFNNFDNPFLFKEINDDDIQSVENYVREDLPGILDAALNESGEMYDSKQKSWFFGAFCTKPTSFHITNGEKKMIAMAIARINEKFSTSENLEYFTKEVYIQKKDRIAYEHCLFDSVFGLVFGDVRAFKKAVKEKNIVEIRNKLFSRTKAVLDKFQSDTIKQVQEFTLDSVNVSVDSDDHVIGSIRCNFCDVSNMNGQIKLFYKTSGSWVLSNLTLHLKRNHTHKAIPIQQSADQSYADMDAAIEPILKVKPKEDGTKAEELIDLKIEPMNQTNTNVYSKQCEDMLYTQMKLQLIKISNMAIKNKDKISDTLLNGNGRKVSKTLKFCEVAGKGDCLFLSIVHQMFGLTIGSDEHNARALQLRKDVSDYILANMDDFMVELKGRLYEEQLESRIIENFEHESKIFLEKLSQESTIEGGAETIKAVSRMENVNIVSVRRDGFCTLTCDFNPNSIRTLLIFYHTYKDQSKNNNMKPNHYDSIVSLSEIKVNTFAQQISQTENKRLVMLNEAVNLSHISLE